MSHRSKKQKTLVADASGDRAVLRVPLTAAQVKDAPVISLSLPMAEEEEEEEEHQEQKQMASSSLLAALVYPLEPDAFIRDHFEGKRALHFSANGAGVSRIHDLIAQDLFGLDLEQMLEQTASEECHVWLKSTTGGAALNSIQVASPEDALKCYESGASLYFRSSQAMADLYLKRLLHDLDLSVAGHYANGDLRAEIETFVSRTGNYTDWHTDYMSNFTVQIEGTKTWKLAQAVIPFPLRGCTPHFKNVDNAEEQLKLSHMVNPAFTCGGLHQLKTDGFFDKECDSVTLQPGDVFYFPAGLWHAVNCDEDSVSINFSLMPSSYADLIGEHLVHLMRKDKRFRDYPTNNPKGEHRFQQLLQELKTHMITKDLTPPVCRAELDCIAAFSEHELETMTFPVDTVRHGKGATVAVALHESVVVIPLSEFVPPDELDEDKYHVLVHKGLTSDEDMQSRVRRELCLSADGAECKFVEKLRLAGRNAAVQLTLETESMAQFLERCLLLGYVKIVQSTNE